MPSVTRRAVRLSSRNRWTKRMRFRCWLTSWHMNDCITANEKAKQQRWFVKRKLKRLDSSSQTLLIWKLSRTVRNRSSSMMVIQTHCVNHWTTSSQLQSGLSKRYRTLPRMPLKANLQMRRRHDGETSIKRENETGGCQTATAHSISLRILRPRRLRRSLASTERLG